MKKILITGSSGLVGSEVVKALLPDRDWQIFAVSSRSLPLSGDNLRCVGNDCIDSILQQEQIDVLLHLAFPRNVSEEKWAPGMRFAAQVLGAARRHGVGKVIHVSSQSVYGWRRTEPAREEDEVVLNSPYTTGKFWSELMVNEMFPEIPHTSVRLSTIIGPTTEERVPNKLFAQIAAGQRLIVKGGKQIFSFMDVRDAAGGLMELVKADRPLRPVYNLGTGEYATLAQMARMAVEIAAKYGCKGEIEIEEADVRLNNRLDVSSMKADFGWEAAYSLRESMENICENTMRK